MPQYSQERPSSGRRKRRGLSSWLVPVSGITSLLAKIRTTRASGKIETKVKSKSSLPIPFKSKKKKEEEEEQYKYEDEEEYYDDDSKDEECLFGDGGVWQRAILMGDKCHPIEFSGAIYYDEKGKKLDGMPPRSPRASPLPPSYKEDADGKFGDGGVWQRAILMGDKCQPIEFSGAIHYDERGNKLDGLPPRSPRASPLPAYMSPAIFRGKAYK